MQRQKRVKTIDASGAYKIPTVRKPRQVLSQLTEGAGIEFQQK